MIYYFFLIFTFVLNGWALSLFNKAVFCWNVSVWIKQKYFSINSDFDWAKSFVNNSLFIFGLLSYILVFSLRLRIELSVIN